MLETREKLEKVSSNNNNNKKKNQMEILEMKNLIIQMKTQGTSFTAEWRQQRKE